MEKFKNMISPSLRKEIAKHVFSKIIFKDASDSCVNFILENVNTISMQPEDSVVR